ncbi:MAG: hypothetical protein JW913_14930 [Chitinispirillaceae bacterium]|nr:hypothetical protein [Chitinispirillaceae bacterium]
MTDLLTFVSALTTTTTAENEAVRYGRDFYDRIGRDENELNRIRQYIRNNPAEWHADNENPVKPSPRYVAMPNPQR